MNGNTTKPSNPFRDVTVAQFLKKSAVLSVVLRTTSYTTTTETMDNTNAKSVVIPSLQVNTLPLPRVFSVLTADETYIKVRGVKGYIWFVMYALSRSIIGYRVSDNRSVGPCILAMRQALKYFKKLPKHFRFIADGYSAYPLAAQEFKRKLGDDFSFNITQVIGLTNDDEVSKEFRPYKQMIERLNRTFKASYRITNGFDNYDGANYNVALWVAYYNFLRPHQHNNYKVLNSVKMLDNADNMPGKWQLLIYLGQQTILHMQNQNCSCHLRRR